MNVIANKVSAQAPIQEKIKADIIAQITSGALNPGDSLFSTQKMSEIYNVSLVTAHKALKDLTAQKYLIRQNGKGTFVAERTSKTSFSKVGVPVYLQHNPFHVHMIEAISDQALKRKVSIVLGQGKKKKEFIDKLVSNDISTMIRFPRNSVEESLTWELIKAKNINSVTVNDFWLDGGPFPSVRTDEEYGIKKVMEHLISVGHRDIIFFDEDSLEPRIGAFNAYYQSLMLHNIPFDPKRVMHYYNYRKDPKEMVRDLSRLGTAVVATYDIYAITIINALKEEGIKVGKDYSVVGFDGIEDAESYGLTTVEQPVDLLIEHAFRILDERVEGIAPEKLSIKPTLIIRDSTGRVNCKK